MSATPSQSEDRLELYIRQSRPLLSEVLRNGKGIK